MIDIAIDIAIAMLFVSINECRHTYLCINSYSPDIGQVCPVVASYHLWPLSIARIPNRLRSTIKTHQEHIVEHAIHLPAIYFLLW